MKPINREYLNNKFNLAKPAAKEPSKPNPRYNYHDTHPISKEQFVLMFGDSFAQDSNLPTGQSDQVLDYYSLEGSPESNELSPSDFFRYALRTEIEMDKAAITQQACQEIETVLVEEMEQRENGITQKAYYKTVERDPSKDYGGANLSQPLKKVLVSHSELFAKRCGLNDLSKRTKERINAIIERASSVVPLISTRQTTPLSGKVEQKAKVEQKQEQKKRNVQLKNQRLFKHRHKKYQTSIFDGPIQKSFGDKVHSPNKWLQDFFSPDLLFLSNALGKFKNARQISSEKPSLSDSIAIMPATMLLIEEIEGKRKAFAISDQDAIDFIQEMQNHSDSTSKKLCILTSTGRLVHNNGESKGGFSEKEVEALRNSTWMKEILTEVHFWNGKINDYEWLQDKLDINDPEKKEKTIKAWNWIRQHHINKKHVQNKLFHFALKGESLPDPDIFTSEKEDTVSTPQVMPSNQDFKIPSPKDKPDKTHASARRRVRSLWKRKRWFKAATILSLGTGWLIAWAHYARTKKKNF